MTVLRERKPQRVMLSDKHAKHFTREPDPARVPKVFGHQHRTPSQKQLAARARRGTPPTPRGTQMPEWEWWITPDSPHHIDQEPRWKRKMWRVRT